jgi:hypothetical protein
VLLLVLLNLPQVDSVALGGSFPHDRLLRSQEVPVARLILLHDELLRRINAGVLAYPSFHRLYQALSEATFVHNVEIFLSCWDVSATPCRDPGQVFDHDPLVNGLLDLLLICERPVGTLQLRPQIVYLLSYLVTSLSIEGSLSKVCLCCHLLGRVQLAYQVVFRDPEGDGANRTQCRLGSRGLVLLTAIIGFLLK